MSDDIGSHEVPVPCPGCGQENRKSLRWLKDNDTIICERCGARITLNKQGPEALDEIESSLANIRNMLKGFGR